MRELTFMVAVALCAVVIAQEDELVPAPYLAVRYTAPPDAPSSGALAPAAEPGERLAVMGRVLSGAAPVAGASLFIFQTDSKGEYAPGIRGNDAELNPRLHALLRTDSQGRYRFESIRPGSYNGNASHVHYIVNIRVKLTAVVTVASLRHRGAAACAERCST